MVRLTDLPFRSTRIEIPKLQNIFQEMINDVHILFPITAI